MNISERLRANLDRALVHHRLDELHLAVAEERAAGPALTITTLAPLAGSTRSTLAGLGGHTRISTLQRIAGVLGCTVPNLLEGVEPVEPVDLEHMVRRAGYETAAGWRAAIVQAKHARPTGAPA